MEKKAFIVCVCVQLFLLCFYFLCNKSHCMWSRRIKCDYIKYKIVNILSHSNHWIMVTRPLYWKKSKRPGLYCGIYWNFPLSFCFYFDFKNRNKSGQTTFRCHGGHRLDGHNFHTHEKKMCLSRTCLIHMEYLISKYKLLIGGGRDQNGCKPN